MCLALLESDEINDAWMDAMDASRPKWDKPARTRQSSLDYNPLAAIDGGAGYDPMKVLR